MGAFFIEKMLAVSHFRKVYVLLFIVVASFFVSWTAFAQGEISSQREVFFRDEQTWAGSAHSTGYGIDFGHHLSDQIPPYTASV